MNSIAKFAALPLFRCPHISRKKRFSSSLSASGNTVFALKNAEVVNNICHARLHKHLALTLSRSASVISFIFFNRKIGNYERIRDIFGDVVACFWNQEIPTVYCCRNIWKFTILLMQQCRGLYRCSNATTAKVEFWEFWNGTLYHKERKFFARC